VLAIEFKKMFIKEEHLNKICVVAHIDDKNWQEIFNDDDVPKRVLVGFRLMATLKAWEENGLLKQPLSMTITMPYIKDLSVNSYKIMGRGGRHTTATKPHVTEWMNELADKIREHELFNEFFGTPATIYVKGFFVDDRAPDIHNLAKVICDAIEPAIGVNDKNIRFKDEGYETGYISDPHLEIELVQI